MRLLRVQSKYVRALQDTFNDFGTLFPEHPGLHKVEAPLGDPSKMLALSGRHSLLTKLVYDEYARRQIPLGVFARLIGKSQIEVWGGLISGGGHLTRPWAMRMNKQNRRCWLTRPIV